MYLPRGLRDAAGLADIAEDYDPAAAVPFRDLLLDALASDPDVHTAIRRIAGPAKKPPPEPRSTRRR